METKREKIIQRFGYDPIAMLYEDDWDQAPDPKSVYGDAIVAVAQLGADVLRPLLKSSDKRLSGRGLFVFSELGKNGSILINDVISSVNHPRAGARWHALEGLLYHASALNAGQVARILSLAADPPAFVRTKVIEIIAAVPVTKIEAAQKLMGSSKHFDHHKKGLELLRNPLSVEKAMAICAEGETVTCCYAYANLIAAAKSGHLIEIPESKKESDETRYVRQWLKLINKRQLR